MTDGGERLQIEPNEGLNGNICHGDSRFDARNKEVGDSQFDARNAEVGDSRLDARNAEVGDERISAPDIKRNVHNGHCVSSPSNIRLGG